MNASDELLAVFKDEVQEQLESLFAALEEDPEGWDLQVLFRMSHNIKGAARMVEAAGVRDAAHALEDLFAALRDGAPRTDDIVTLAREGCALLEANFHSLDQECPDIGDFRCKLASCLDKTAEGGTPAPGAKASEAEFEEVQKETTADEAGEAANDEPEEKRSDGAAPATGDTIRLGVDRVENLMGFAAELVSGVNVVQQLGQTARELSSMISQLQRKAGLDDASELQATKQFSDELRRSIVHESTRQEQLSARFQDALRTLRMIRVDSVGSLLKKVVRDTARATGRAAQLEIVGGGTEMDRVALDGMRDPLIHLIRNAVSHGIESPEERLRVGKPRKGTVTMRVSSSGTWVEIVLSDDGKGIELEQIRNVAVNKGIATREDLASRSDDDIRDLIFAPGYSSMENVTEISGRGVGLDVVRKNLLNLGGFVSMETTPGAGTSFRLRVPLTRLTTYGVLVRVGKQLYALPASGLDRVVLVNKSEIAEVDGKDVLRIDDEVVPVTALDRVLKITADDSPHYHALVLSGDGSRHAFLVNEVLGQKEFVIQGLSWNLKHVPGIMGGTVIDGNRVVFILNTRELLGTRSAKVSATTAGSARDDVQLKHILVVDDSVTSRTLVRNILASVGYDVEVAIDGVQAWARLREADFDLVVSDVEMPNMDGFTLTEQIRSDSELGELPVILVTSMGSEEHKNKGAEAGANAYIVKGAFDQDELLTAVGRLL